MRGTARRASLRLALSLGAALPGGASADRGALTVEAGPTPVLLLRTAPPVPGAEGLRLLALGAVGGVRYALENDLEVSATGFYQAPATGSASLLSGSGVVVGTVATSATSFGAFLGARYVVGLTFRFHLGAELGFAHLSFSGTRAALAVAGPAPAGSPGRDGFAAAARAGVEWQWNDHMCLAAEGRVQTLVGGAPASAILLPITFGYSWYLF